MSAGPRSPDTVFCETIRYSAEGERKYIRYYDGRGHFGHVHLRLIPRSGQSCTVSFDAGCRLSQECCLAIQQALTRCFKLAHRSHLELIGFESRVMGGNYLNRHSYPEAHMQAAYMAFDEALRRACPLIVERYVGVLLLIALDDLVWVTKTLCDLLGELHTTQRVTNVVQLKINVPLRLVGRIRSLGIQIAKQFPLPSEKRYQSVLMPGTSNLLPDDLSEWT